MQKFKRFLSFLLLFVLSVSLLPKEVLHELHHHDTKDHIEITEKGKFRLEKVHRHCIALQLTSPPVNHTAAFYPSFVLFLLCTLIGVEKALFTPFFKSPGFYLRGPPSDKNYCYK